MTVSAQTPISRSTGNGVTTVFPYTFKIISDGDIEVSVDDVVKTLNVDYTVSGAGLDAGGDVTMTTAPAVGTTVVRRRDMAIVRSTDYQDQGTLPAATLDLDIDSTVLMMQQLDERLGRTFSLPASSAAAGTMPTPAAGYVLGWDALGKNLTNLPASAGTSLIDLAASSGSSLVGFIQSGAGAVATTVQTKLRESVSVKDFGAVGDGVTDDTVAIQAALTDVPDGVTLTFPKDSTFFVGDIAGDTAKFTITKNIRILFNNAIFTCTASGTASAAALFKFVDCKTYVDSLRINQTNFSYGGANRGVVAVLICAVATSVNGHYVKAHVVNGQSPLTVTSASPTLYRSGDIEAKLTADTTYYGINLAYNGDRVRGSVYANSYLRLFFAYDVDDVNMDLHGGLLPQDTSGALNLTNRKVRPTQNIKLRAVFEALAGPIILDDLTTDAGTGEFINIDLDIYVKAFAGTMVSSYVSDGVIRVGSFDAGSSWETAATQTTKVQLKCAYKAPYEATYPAVYVYTPSSGRRTIDLKANNTVIYNQHLLSSYTLSSGVFRKLAVNTSTINVSVAELHGFTATQVFILDLLVSVREDTAFFGQNTTTERWQVHGFVSGAGILNIQAYNRAHTSKTGAKATTITMAATGSDASFNVTATGYTISATHNIAVCVTSLLL